jgi:hypothetical protein
MSMKPAAVKTVTVKLPAELEKRVSATARKRRMSRSELIRESIRRHLEQPVEPPPGSFLEAAGDLIGSVEGPSDLSTNPRYLDGFGK